MVATLALAGTGVLTAAGAAQAAGSGPCDIYATGGTPCVAAYSTVRALYSAYNGPLYQVRRVSDGAAADIGLLAAGGYANASEQDAFCAHTACVITELLRPVAEGNNLTVEGAGGAAGADVGANAAALPVTAGGNKVYGLYIAGQTGYRDNSTHGVAVDGAARGHVHGGQRHPRQLRLLLRLRQRRDQQPTTTATGTWTRSTWAPTCYFAPCTGTGPWVEADMENGLFSGATARTPANAGNSSDFVTAMLKNNGQTTYALKGGDAQSGGLSTWWDGALPDIGGYTPMHQEGGIVLGTGGDNSNAVGRLVLRGRDDPGYPSDADRRTRSRPASSRPATPGVRGRRRAPAGTTPPPGGQCVDVLGDDSGTDGAAVDLWGCQSGAVDQHWTHNSDDSLSHAGPLPGHRRRRHRARDQSRAVGLQRRRRPEWVQQANGSLLNPQSGLCLDDPSGNTLMALSCRSGPVTASRRRCSRSTAAA